MILQYVAQEGQKALERVRNAVEAVAEQIQRGNARTPSAQLVNAIRRGWTSNAWKRMNRQQAGVTPGSGPGGGGEVNSGGERSSPAIGSPTVSVEPAAELMVNYQGYVLVCDDLSQVIALIGVEADRLGGIRRKCSLFSSSCRAVPGGSCRMRSCLMYSICCGKLDH